MKNLYTIYSRILTLSLNFRTKEIIISITEMSNKRKSDLLNNDDDSYSSNSTVKNDTIGLDDSLIFSCSSDKSPTSSRSSSCSSAGSSQSTSSASSSRNSCKRSKWWQYFTPVEQSENLAKCSLCNLNVKGSGNTRNFASHFQNHHPVEFSNIKGKFKQLLYKYLVNH